MRGLILHPTLRSFNGPVCAVCRLGLEERVSNAGTGLSDWLDRLGIGALNMPLSRFAESIRSIKLGIDLNPT